MSQTYYVLLECLAQDHMSFLATMVRSNSKLIPKNVPKMSQKCPKNVPISSTVPRSLPRSLPRSPKSSFISHICGNVTIFLLLRFYVKSILWILEVQNLPLELMWLKSRVFRVSRDTRLFAFSLARLLRDCETTFFC